MSIYLSGTDHLNNPLMHGGNPGSPLLTYQTQKPNRSVVMGFDLDYSANPGPVLPLNDIHFGVDLILLNGTDDLVWITRGLDENKIPLASWSSGNTVIDSSVATTRGTFSSLYAINSSIGLYHWDLIIGTYFSNSNLAYQPPEIGTFPLLRSFSLFILIH